MRRDLDLPGLSDPEGWAGLCTQPQGSGDPALPRAGLGSKASQEPWKPSLRSRAGGLSRGSPASLSTGLSCAKALHKCRPCADPVPLPPARPGTWLLGLVKESCPEAPLGVQT